MAGFKKFKTYLRKVIEEKGSERKIALGFAVGVFISFTPLLSLHTIMAVIVAFIFRFNKVATITGAWVNNPYTIPFVYYFSYKIGTAFVGSSVPSPSFENFDIKLLLDYFKAFGVPLFLGTTITGLMASLISYYLMLYAIISLRKKSSKKGGPGEGIKI